MSYQITEIEVTQPLPSISVSGNETGIAIFVRSKGRPVAFWMEALPADAVCTPEDLSERISEKAGIKLLSESIREELAAPVKSDRFPSLTIAICTRDRQERLARCLKSLRALRPLASDSTVSLEILVVDNAPSDEGTRELAASQPEVRYCCEPKPGLDFARNRAVREATGELLAFLDDDVTVDSCWLAGLMEAWAENPDAAAFTGLVLPYELVSEAQIIFEKRGGFRRGFEKIRYKGQTMPANPLYPCASGIFGAGANMAFRKDILLKLGGFDEALDTGSPLPGGGDLDIWYRVIRAGYPLVYEPKYLVFHQHRRDLKALRRQYWSWGSGLMAFVGKHYKIDHLLRPKLRSLVWWWFKNQLRQLQSSLRGRHVLPPGMILAEFFGGIIGLLGEYPRSVRRVEQIRKRFAAETVSSLYEETLPELKGIIHSEKSAEKALK
jgi:GT2 family glycosyltransferase